MSMKRKTIAIVAGVAVFAAVSASAATLGGLTTGDVGANSGAVAGQIANGVTVSFGTTYDATLGAYKVTTVTLTASGTEKFPANGAIALTLKGAGGTALTELTLTPSTAASSEVLTYGGSTAISAYSIQGVSLVVNGGATTVALSTP